MKFLSNSTLSLGLLIGAVFITRSYTCDVGKILPQHTISKTIGFEQQFRMDFMIYFFPFRETLVQYLFHNFLMKTDNISLQVRNYAKVEVD